ncbi:MAG: L,D-transpeptidase [Atopobiaceae bacterium]
MPQGNEQGGSGATGGNGAKPAKRHHRGPIIALVIVLVLLASAYGGGVYYFQSHFLPNTTANGYDVSLQTSDQLQQDVQSSAAQYTLQATAGQFQHAFTSDELGLSVDASSVASSAMQQSARLATRWPLELTKSHVYQADEGTAVDQDKLQASVTQSVDDYNSSATLPQDATVGYDDQQGSFVVNPEVAGTAVVADVVSSAVQQGALALQPSVACDDSAIVAPNLTSSDAGLAAAANKANQMLQLQIPLTEDGQQKLTVNRDQILNWISIDDQHQVSVDTGAISTYVKKTVAPACAKSDDTHTYSVDRKKLTQSIADGVNDLSNASIEVPLVSKEKAKQADTTQTTQTNWDGSGRYLDVDISNQYARLYDEQGNVLWETSVVTGNTSEGRSTPTGTYSINAKTRDMTLTGSDENGDGKPDYTSHVDYWMPFIGNSYGFHDATWRSNFGGSIYKSSGSHGCVNLPYAKAQQLFSLVNVGDRVVIHK